MKYLFLVGIIILAGGLFAWQMQAPTTSTSQQEETSPFDSDTPVVGTVTDENPTPSQGSSADVTATVPSTPPATQGTGTAPQAITRSVLATHNTQKDCWVAYKGVVYDITNWLPRHPGSAGAIAPYCGTADEFTAAFNKKHGTKQENRLMREGVNEGAYAQ